MKYAMLGDPKTGALNTYHLIIAPTYDCNLACRHCYNIRIDERVSQKQWEEFIDRWADFCHRESKSSIAHFKGGEPFVYPAIDDLAARAAAKNQMVFFTSNGTLIDEKKAEDLGKFYTSAKGKVILSLNGSRPAIDEQLRQPGVYDKTIAAAKNLRKNDVPFDINFVLHEGNISDLTNAIYFAKELGAVQFNVLPLVAKGHAENNGLKVLHAGKEIFQQLDTAMNNDAVDLLEWSYADLIRKLSNGYTCEGCTAGYRGLAYARPDGDIYSCPNTVLPEFRLGSIDDDFEKVFDGPTAKRLRAIHEGRLVCKGELEMYKGHDERTETLEASDVIIKELCETEAVKKTNCKSQYASTGISEVALCFNRNL